MLRTPELKPYIIYVRAPQFERLKETRHRAYARSTFDETSSRSFTVSSAGLGWVGSEISRVGPTKNSWPYRVKIFKHRVKIMSKLGQNLGSMGSITYILPKALVRKNLGILTKVFGNVSLTNSLVTRYRSLR